MYTVSCARAEHDVLNEILFSHRPSIANKYTRAQVSTPPCLRLSVPAAARVHIRSLAPRLALRAPLSISTLRLGTREAHLTYYHKEHASPAPHSSHIAAWHSTNRNTPRGATLPRPLLARTHHIILW